MKNRVRMFGIAFAALMLSQSAHASLFQGETLDKVAGAVSWVALIVAPITLISLFWLVHILPEKVAEKKHHPQTKAIQVLCLLSLAFGGLLWPVALLWAYSKPVLYKMAYGNDVVRHDAAGPESTQTAQGEIARSEPAGSGELESLRSKIAMLEAQLGQRPSTH